MLRPTGTAAVRPSRPQHDTSCRVWPNFLLVVLAALASLLRDCLDDASRRLEDLLGNLETHRARGALDGLDGGLDAGGIEVGHLGAGDLFDLLLGDLADLGLVRHTGPLRHAGGAK